MTKTSTHYDTPESPRMTFHDLEHSVHEGIIAMTDDPAEISAERLRDVYFGAHPRAQG